jgi:hypothetical protein
MGEETEAWEKDAGVEIGTSFIMSVGLAKEGL